MRQITVVGIILILAGIIFFKLFPNSGGEFQGVIKQISGKVEIQRNPNSTWEQAKIQDKIQVGGAIKTGSDGNAALALPEGDVLTFKPGSYFELSGKVTIGTQKNGKLQLNIKSNGREVRILTPHAITTVLGTVFVVEVEPKKTFIALFEGKVDVENLKSKKKVLLSPKSLVEVSETEIGEPQAFSFNTDSSIPLEFEFKPGSSPRKPVDPPKDQINTTPPRPTTNQPEPITPEENNQPGPTETPVGANQNEDTATGDLKINKLSDILY